MTKKDIAARVEWLLSEGVVWPLGNSAEEIHCGRSA
jgi:hypothetical protein